MTAPPWWRAGGGVLERVGRRHRGPDAEQPAGGSDRGALRRTRGMGDAAPGQHPVRRAVGDLPAGARVVAVVDRALFRTGGGRGPGCGHGRRSMRWSVSSPGKPPTQNAPSPRRWRGARRPPGVRAMRTAIPSPPALGPSTRCPMFGRSASLPARFGLEEPAAGAEKAPPRVRRLILRRGQAQSPGAVPGRRGAAEPSVYPWGWQVWAPVGRLGGRPMTCRRRVGAVSLSVREGPAIHRDDALRRRRAVTEDAVRAHRVMLVAPLFDQDPGLPDRMEGLLAGQLFAEPGVEAFDVAVILGDPGST